MGRHGGGSRSGGGGSSSGSSGGSRSGGSKTRTSTTPFKGCYNRSYYDRNGKYHSYYTSNRNFGAKRGWSGGILFALVFITIHMVIMVGGFSSTFIQFGEKVNGDPSRISVVDNADILTSKEEAQIKDLFEDVYDASGMPVTLYTEDFSWKEHYNNLEVLSEELYYSISFDEDAMLILFTTEEVDGFVDWEYDMYCGDDTLKCFSDAEFNTLLDNFQKGMAGQNLVKALDYSWNSVMDDIGKTNINWSGAPMILGMLVFYSIFYIAIFSSIKQQNTAYK